MACKSLCRMIRNGPLNISKSLKKAENGPFSKNLFPITVIHVCKCLKKIRSRPIIRVGRQTSNTHICFIFCLILRMLIISVHLYFYIATPSRSQTTEKSTERERRSRSPETSAGNENNSHGKAKKCEFTVACWTKLGSVGTGHVGRHSYFYLFFYWYLRIHVELP